MAQRSKGGDGKELLDDTVQLGDVVVETKEAIGSQPAEDGEETTPKSPAVPAGQAVLGGLTIRELEMMPKLEEISRLGQITVGGTTHIEPEVIGAIAGVATNGVEGVASLGTTSLRSAMRERFGGAEKRASSGVAVEAGTREAIVDINLRVIYGYPIPMIVVKIRHAVADQLLRYCGLLAKEINIRVSGLEFPERMPGKVL